MWRVNSSAIFFAKAIFKGKQLKIVIYIWLKNAIFFQFWLQIFFLQQVNLFSSNVFMAGKQAWSNWYKYGHEKQQQVQPITCWWKIPFSQLGIQLFLFCNITLCSAPLVEKSDKRKILLWLCCVGKNTISGPKQGCWLFFICIWEVFNV